MRLTSLLIGLAAALAIATPQTATAQHAPNTSPSAAAADHTTISVNGTARVYRKPDYVDMNIGVTNHAKSAAEAQAGASKGMSQVIEAVKRLGLAGQDLQTGSVQLSPRYSDKEVRQTGERELLGYTASISLRIRTSNIDSVPSTLDAVIAAGANRIDDVQFGIKEALEAREEAIRLATKAATRKARVLAESLDLEVVRIISAATHTQQYGRSNYGNRMMAQVAGDSGGGEERESPVVPGQVEVWAQVDVQVAAAPSQ